MLDRPQAILGPTPTVQFSIIGTFSRCIAFAAKTVGSGSELFKQWMFFG
jgi:hypothetical protein